MALIPHLAQFAQSEASDPEYLMHCYRTAHAHKWQIVDILWLYTKEGDLYFANEICSSVGVFWRNFDAD